MLYIVLKIIHIFSASLFVGSLIAGFYLTLAYSRIENQDQLTSSFKNLVRYDFRLSMTALILQPITGFAIIGIKHYNPMALWVLGTMAGYALLGCLWLAMLFQQSRIIFELSIPGSPNLRSYIRGRAWLLSISLPCLVVLYYLMTNRPS